MCTVLLAYHYFDSFPLYVAANRDENRDRPAETMRLRDGELRYIAPRDLEAGGTWIGVNEAGVVVAITNRFGSPPDRSRRSRGELVERALAQRTVAAASSAILALDPLAYNGFHLSIASTDVGQIIWSDTTTFHERELEPGIHIVTERSFDAAPSEREAWLRQQIDEVDAPETLDELLLHRAKSGFEGTLVDVPEFNYGTRSSTLIGIGADYRLFYADGPPPAQPYEDLSEQLSRLLAQSA